MKKVVTAAVLTAIDQSFNALFTQGAGRVPGYVRRLCTQSTSTTAEEFYGWLSAIAGLDKNAAEAVVARLSADGHSIKNHEFKKIFALPRTAIEDDSYGIFGKAMEAIGQRGAQTPDLEFIDVLLASFTTAKAYTGKSLFATDHKIGTQTFSNRGTKKLSAANFAAGYAAIRGMKDGAGKPLFTLADPSKVFLVVGENYESTADGIVRMAMLAGGGNNPNFNKAQVEVVPGLGDMWFIIDNSGTVGPVIFQERLPLELTAAIDPTDANVFRADEYQWKARSRFAVGTGDPRYGYGSTGVDAA